MVSRLVAILLLAAVTTAGALGAHHFAVIGVHDISLAPFRPYPGSELFRGLQAKDVIPKKLDDAYYQNLASTAESVGGSFALSRS